MAVVIVVAGSATQFWPKARYLKSYNPDYQPPKETPWGIIGMSGLADFTDDVRDALRFANIVDAIECWKRQSTVIPFRPDGKPNRPLTAYTITFETVPDA